MEKTITGFDIDWMDIQPAHNLPERKMTTWTFHDKPSKGKHLRATSVTIALSTGEIFTGVSVCSEADVFSKKAGFQRAYGLALQKVAAYLRGLSTHEGTIVLTQSMQDINRHIAGIAYMAKLDVIKQIWVNRFALARMKGVDLNLIGK